MGLPKDHPLAGFNDYFYLESGMGNMPIYIFKFGEKGILVELHLNEKGSDPRARLYSLDFENDYDFKIHGLLKTVIEGNFDKLYNGIVEALNEEVRYYARKQS